MKLIFSSPFPYCTLWKQVTKHSPNLRVVESCSTSLWMESLHKMIELNRIKILVCSLQLFIDSIIYLYQYRFMEIYFIFWAIIQCYFILWLTLFHLWSLGILSIGSCLPLICSIIVRCYLFIFGTSIISGTIRYFRLLLCISCIVSHFSKDS